MLDYAEYLGVPAGIMAVLAVVLFAMNFSTDALKLKELAKPELISGKKRRQRKKREREALSKLPEFMDNFSGTATTLREVNERLADFNSHYSADNISQRNSWIHDVDRKLSEVYETQAARDALMVSLAEKIDKNNADTLSILIDNKRNSIIDFASRVADPNYSATREQFKRVFRLHEEYEKIIEENGLTNGEVDIAYRIITEAYEDHLRRAAFIEDVRGYVKN